MECKDHAHCVTDGYDEVHVGIRESSIRWQAQCQAAKFLESEKNLAIHILERESRIDLPWCSVAIWCRKGKIATRDQGLSVPG